MKTLNEIELLIANEQFITLGIKTTVCLMTLKNGFEIIGTSACVNPKDYNIEIGKKYAREKAMDKLWELEGYSDQNKMIG